MRQRNEKLSHGEHHAKRAYETRLALARPSRKTKGLYAVLLSGSVGSGKSIVARAVARAIGATVIEADAIRVELRKLGESYDNVWRIAEHLMWEAIQRGESVVFDRDSGEFRKQASIYARLQKSGARILRIRTYAHRDIILGRIISAPPDIFFAGASTEWTGPAQIRGALVKAREFWRRTPHHYRWSANGGGAWILKKPTMKLDLDLDTSVLALWQKEVEKFIKKLK